MSYANLHTEVARDVALASVSADARWLYIQGFCYAQVSLKDGFIAAPLLPTLGLPVPTPEMAAELVSIGKWEVVDGGWQIHDYLDWNLSAEKRAERTAFAAQRKQEQRARERARKNAGLIVQTAMVPRQLSDGSVRYEPEVPEGGSADVRPTPSEAQASPRPSPVPVVADKPKQSKLIEAPARAPRTMEQYGFKGARFSVPRQFHDELVKRYGGDPGRAEAEIYKFYGRIEDSMGPDDAVPNIYKFINGHFERWVADRAAKTPVLAGAGDQRVGVSDDFRAQLREADERRSK